MTDPSPLPLPDLAGPDTFGISYSKPKLVKSVLGFLLLAAVVLTCGGFIHPRWAGWCLIAFGVVSIIVAFAEAMKLFTSRPAAVLTREGLSDNSQKPSVFIRWDDVRKVTLLTVRYNGIPRSRKLILQYQNGPDETAKREIELDTLKGNPKAIAETVLVWSNNARPAAASIALQEDASEQPKR